MQIIQDSPGLAKDPMCFLPKAKAAENKTRSIAAKLLQIETLKIYTATSRVSAFQKSRLHVTEWSLWLLPPSPANNYINKNILIQPH